MSRPLKAEFGCVVCAVITEVMVRRATVSGVVYDTAPADIPVRALWDTGAGMSVISAKIVEKLALSSAGNGTLVGIGGAMPTELYDISVTLPNKVIFPLIRAAEWEGHRNYDMLIGMDVISRGRFVIDNCAGKTVFTFDI
ncbi:MAG: retropepsin-like domain-containing protein [Spirochaetaceae bacterium]|jgi:predicted aspartyl protease|nr:retropepsin-like domain-containing protein [Spirochaetaceae bacterium]